MSLVTKIYIQDLNLKDVVRKLSVLDEYYKSQSIETKIYSNNEGVFSITNKGIYELKQIDKPLKYYKDYYTNTNTNKTFSLILDESYYEKIQVISQLPNDYLFIKTTIFEFYSNPKVKFIVEGNMESTDIQVPSNKNPISRYANFTITDFYFQTSEDIDNYFIKEELNVFLSTLN